MTLFKNLMFFLTIGVTGVASANSVSQSMGAFERIKSFRKVCHGRDIRVLTGRIAMASGATSAIAALAGTLNEGGGIDGILLEEMESHQKSSLGRNVRREGNVISLTGDSIEEVKKASRTKAYLDRAKRRARYLKQAGKVGLVLSLLMGATALYADSESASDWFENFKGEYLTDSDQSLLAGFGVKKMGDGTLSGYYVNSTAGFLTGFLELPPEQARRFLENDEKLQVLTIGYASFIDSLSDLGSDWKQCKHYEPEIKEAAVTGLRLGIEHGQESTD